MWGNNQFRQQSSWSYRRMLAGKLLAWRTASLTCNAFCAIEIPRNKMPSGATAQRIHPTRAPKLARRKVATPVSDFKDNRSVPMRRKSFAPFAQPTCMEAVNCPTRVAGVNLRHFHTINFAKRNKDQFAEALPPEHCRSLCQWRGGVLPQVVLARSWGNAPVSRHRLGFPVGELLWSPIRPNGHRRPPCSRKQVKQMIISVCANEAVKGGETGSNQQDEGAVWEPWIAR